MREFLIVIIAVCCLASFPAASVGAKRDTSSDALKQLKAQQKQERAAWKIQEKNLKRSLKQQHLSKAMRRQQEHQIERDRRALLARQKDARQQLMDMQRVAKENEKAYR